MSYGILIVSFTLFVVIGLVLGKTICELFEKKKIKWLIALSVVAVLLMVLSVFFAVWVTDHSKDITRFIVFGCVAMLIVIAADFVLKKFQEEIEKREVLLSFATSIVFIVSGYIFVWFSWTGYWNFIDEADANIWFQRSGAAFIGVILYSEYFVNAGSQRMAEIKWEPLKTIFPCLRTWEKTHNGAKRGLHFFTVGLAMIGATVIWGYGDIIYCRANECQPTVVPEHTHDEKSNVAPVILNQ